MLLTIVRLLQGLSVGGQLMSSLVFTLERHPKSKWGLYGSYVMAAANFGTLLGGLVASLIRRSLSEEALNAWGWRIPFLSGILVRYVSSSSSSSSSRRLHHHHHRHRLGFNIISFSGYYLKHHGGDDGKNYH